MDVGFLLLLANSPIRHACMATPVLCTKNCFYLFSGAFPHNQQNPTIINSDVYTEVPMTQFRGCEPTEDWLFLSGLFPVQPVPVVAVQQYHKPICQPKIFTDGTSLEGQHSSTSAGQIQCCDNASSTVEELYVQMTYYTGLIVRSGATFG